VTETPNTEPERSDEPKSGSTPYKNLWIPLVIVPAGIVATILVVFVLFGSIAGEERDLEANLQTVLHGGANEREQAVFGLVRQLEQNRMATLRGEEPPWPVNPEFLDDLRAAWDQLPPDDLDARLVVATTLSQLDDEEGVERLLTLLEVPEEQDPEGQLRFHALAHLGASGNLEARAGLLAFLDHEDPGLRQIAVIGLQNMPGEESLEALSRALEDPVFEIRANAALALSHLEDPRGADLLRDMLEAETYAAVQRENPRKFEQAEAISHSRAAAARGLGELGLEQDRALLEALAREEEDLAVREAAMRAVEAWNSNSE
jgi:HEAT repeat protein